MVTKYAECYYYLREGFIRTLGCNVLFIKRLGNYTAEYVRFNERYRLTEHHSDKYENDINDRHASGDKVMDKLEDKLEDDHESCIAVACRMLSLSEFIRSDCRNEAINKIIPLRRIYPSAEKYPRDIAFRTTRSATETVCRLLNCTGSYMQDSSMLLVISAVLIRILTFYEAALCESQIGRVPADTRDGECSSSQHSDSNHGISTVLSLSEGRGSI
ncbi:Ribosomal protein L10e/L16 [Penicillium canescens]|nr:Ribosomal protein L10e/L16 [Penicillium canescens]